MARWQNPKLRSGHPADEVVSDLQKSTRRGDFYSAGTRAVDLIESGYAGWMWRRLFVICAEDIGPSAPGVPADVWALYLMAVSLTQKRNPSAEEMKLSSLQAMHAIIIMCRARKTRMAADLNFVLQKRFDLGERLGIPEQSIDVHTERGRSSGLKRGTRAAVEHWQRLGRVLQNEDPMGLEMKAALDAIWENEAFSDDV